VPAANPGRPQLIDDVSVTATRQEQRVLDLPFTAECVPGATLRREQMTASVPEALAETPGVVVQQTARSQGSPFLRGFTGFRTVASVDGIHLNNSTFRDGPNQYWSTINALAISRLEAVKVPGSVIYGSAAVGGTVNALMREPNYGFGSGAHWSGATYHRYGSAERAHLGRLEFGPAEREHWGFWPRPTATWRVVRAWACGRTRVTIRETWISRWVTSSRRVRNSPCLSAHRTGRREAHAPHG